MAEFQPILGIVSDNNDPDGLNRIRVYFPYLEGARVCGWIPYQTFMAGEETGTVALPEVGSIVFVNTLDKHRTTMIASGTLYTEKHRPPRTEENSDVDFTPFGRHR